MLPYSDNTIMALINSISGDDAAMNWLEKNNFPELSNLSMSLLYDDNASYNSLLNSDHKELAAFTDALCRDEAPHGLPR